MELTSFINHHTVTLSIGFLMLLGSFATIRSANATAFDHDFALLLLIAGVVCLGFGFGLLDIKSLKDLWPGNIT